MRNREASPATSSRYCPRPSTRPPWIAITLATAFSKVGMPARRSVARGSPPERATRRLARACSRASASGTSAKLPRPSARALPWMTSRCTQWRAPDGSTCRYSPLPSQYLPGLATLRQKAARQRLVGMAALGLGLSGAAGGGFHMVFHGAACETPGACGLAQSSILLVNTHLRLPRSRGQVKAFGSRHGVYIININSCGRAPSTASA